MSDYSVKAHRDVGGDSWTIEPGGSIKIGNMVFTVAADGNVIVTGLPTTEPAAVGALYTATNVLTISNGP